MRIAVIGSGIAGNGAAWRLTRHFGAGAVTQFEAAARPGGHSATVDVEYDGKRLSVDTGFIVYNTLNYPLLTALFAELDVPTHDSDMGFAFSLEGGAFEWSGQERNQIRGLLAQPGNAVSPRFWRMFADMLRFNKAASAARASGTIGAASLGDFVAKLGLGADFQERYLLPMGAAIWSMPARAVLDFPAASFIAFFDNHRLLHASRPRWRTVTGGSREYVRRLLEASGHGLRLSSPVTRIRRLPEGVEVQVQGRAPERFDAVILAAHSDQSLAMLEAPSRAESGILGAIRYAKNDVYLHRDEALMPRRRAAWAAWNVLGAREEADRPVCVSYWMNRLQGLDPARPLFVTLNPPAPPRESHIFGRFSYAHPQYDAAAIAAQARLGSIQGHGGVYFAGAWTGHGFHEDGLRSGYAAADRLIADRARAPEPAIAAAE